MALLRKNSNILRHHVNSLLLISINIKKNVMNGFLTAIPKMHLPSYGA